MEPDKRSSSNLNFSLRGSATSEGIPPKELLSTIELLLTDDAADWAETNYDVINILADPEPTATSVTHFKNLFQERFPTKSLKVNQVSFDSELQDLKQKNGESLLAYYKRVLLMMQRVGAKDRPVSGSGIMLSSLKVAMLDSIIRAFIRGLSDDQIRLDSTRMLASSERSLRGVYTLAEESRRTKEEFQKFKDEQSKQEELDFLREVVQRNMSPAQIQVLKASYHNKDPSFYLRPEDHPGQPMAHTSTNHTSIPAPVHPPQPGFNPYQPVFNLQSVANPYQSVSPYQSGLFQPYSYQPYPPFPPYSPGQPPFPDQNQQPPPPPPRNQYNLPVNPFTSKPSPKPDPAQAELSQVQGESSKDKQPETLRKFPPLPSIEDLPDRSGSRNPYVNGTKTWRPGMGPLCITCGEVGHIAKECLGEKLENWERSHLRILIYGDRNVNSVGAGYDSSSTGSGSALMTPSSSSSPSIQSNSVTVGSSLEVNSPTHTVQSFLGEGSGPNKRAQEDPLPNQPPTAVPRTSGPGTTLPSIMLPPVIPQTIPAAPIQNANQLPNPMPQAAVPPGTVPPFIPQTVYPQAHPNLPSIIPERPKKKGQKRVAKRTEMQPIVGLMNDVTGIYDKPVSIRNVLKQNKVDISLMDWIAWSPTACREIKRLCTRVSKKRTKKPVPVSAFQPQQFGQTQFQPLQTGQTMPQSYQYGNQLPFMLPNQSVQFGSGSQDQEVLHVEVGADSQTRRVVGLLSTEKAFRIPCTIRIGSMDIPIDRGEVQADQGSDMNVISMGMVRKLGLELYSLDSIGFRGLTMRTADHKETPLLYWVWFDLGVQGIWRKVRCFVSPRVIPIPSMEEPISLLLGIPWLYSVNAMISVRESKIEIGDPGINEEVRAVQSPQLAFSSEHEILMHPTTKQRPLPVFIESQDESESEESSESEDDLSDVEDPRTSYSIQFPDRAVIRGDIHTTLSLQELEDWAREIGISLGPLVETSKHRFLALELLHHYRHLNGEDLTNLPCTDLITHRVRLVPGTKLSSLPQLRWPAHKEWWLRKLVSDGLTGGIYEHTGKHDGRLSLWNARAVLVDKTENPLPTDEPRLTFDYFRVHEELPGIYVELSSRTHDNLSNSLHGCLFSADLKHAYFTINLEEESRPYFAFTIPGSGQLQPTRMPQGSKSASFIMTEVTNRAFGEIPGEPSLFHFTDPFQLPNLCFYMDDFFGGQPAGFFPLYDYLRQHFLSRLEWARLKLSFKKLQLWCTQIKVLGVTHEVGGKIRVLEDRVRKIAECREPRNVREVRGFLGILGITRRWIKNFSEVARPLSRLTGKVPWKWGACEQLSFELLRIKAASATLMHGINLSDITHFYTDASGYGGGLVITQERSGGNGQPKEVPILYDSMTFTTIQRKYVTYKRELFAMTRLVIKYDYLAKHPHHAAIIHTDHKPLTHFLTSINDVHEGIYGHWADQLRRLNVIIRYISGPRNKVADGLSRTLFHSDACEDGSVIQDCLDELRQWIWSDRKGVGYEHLLKSLTIPEQEEVIDKGTLHGISVFAIGSGSSWAQAYQVSFWYGDIYRFLEADESPTSTIFRKAMSYRVDPDTKILWITMKRQTLPCILETKVLDILRSVHDKSGHWGKEGTLAKLRGLVYWPNQSEDVSSYIAGCMECARHGPALRSQPLHPIRVIHPFQLLGMDYIGPLIRTTNGNIYILHIIDYLTRFFFTYACPSATPEDTIRCLGILFTLYGLPKAFYTDSGTHFDAEEVRTFLRSRGVSFDYSPSSASKSTGMIEVGNKLLEQVLRKQGLEWDLALASSTLQLNSRTVSHLHMSPSEIFLGIPSPSLGSIDSTLAYVPGSTIKSWHHEMIDPDQHTKAVSNYITYRAQVRDYIKKLSDEKKEAEAARYDRGVSRIYHQPGSMVMLYQKDTGKLEARWRGPFLIDQPGAHGTSWRLRQLNGRLIRRTYHGDHLKPFIPRTGYLAGDESYQGSTNLRRTRKRKVIRT